jgi:hypothetical protein
MALQVRFCRNAPAVTVNTWLDVCRLLLFLYLDATQAGAQLGCD